MLYNPDVQISTHKAFAESMVRLGAKFRNSIILCANTSNVFGMQLFEKTFPERFINFGNGLSTMVGSAPGFIVRGKIPFLCAYAGNITGHCFEQIRNFIAFPHHNVKIIGLNGGIFNGEEGAIWQPLEDVALMRSLPHMKVICPADAIETKRAIEMMMLDYGSTYLRLSYLPLPDLYSQDHHFEFGKGSIYKQGSDVCIFSYGPTLHTSLEAAQILEREGISTMVINMASIKPLDVSLVAECARQIPHIVSVEDHQTVGGLGSAIAEVLTDKYPATLLRIGMEGFGESGKVDDLYKKYRLNGQGIAERVLQSLREK